MTSCDGLKVEMETIHQQMLEPKKNEQLNALSAVQPLCKEFGFVAGMVKGRWMKAENRNEY